MGRMSGVTALPIMPNIPAIPYDTRGLFVSTPHAGAGLPVYVPPDLTGSPLRYRPTDVTEKWIRAKFEGHVREANLAAFKAGWSFGETSEANCHPFFFGKFLMMHNGSIEGFDQIKREMRRGLSPCRNMLTN